MMAQRPSENKPAVDLSHSVLAVAMERGDRLSDATLASYLEQLRTVDHQRTRI